MASSITIDGLGVDTATIVIKLNFVKVIPSNGVTVVIPMDEQRLN